MKYNPLARGIMKYNTLAREIMKYNPLARRLICSKTPGCSHYEALVAYRSTVHPPTSPDFFVVFHFLVFEKLKPRGGRG